MCNAALEYGRQQDEEMIEGGEGGGVGSRVEAKRRGKGALGDVAGVLASAGLLRVFARLESTDRGRKARKERKKQTMQ